MGLLDKKEEEAMTPDIVVISSDTDKVPAHSGETPSNIDVSISFEEHIKRFKKAIQIGRKNSLRNIWEMGSFVNLLKNKKAYGEKTVESFIDAMDDVTVSPSEVYKWAQFAERYTVEQLEVLLDKGASVMGWGVVANLIRLKDVKARTLLEEQIYNGVILPSKVQDTVSSINKSLGASKNAEEVANKLKEKAKGSAPMVNLCVASFKKMNKLAETMLTNEENCAKDITDLSAILDDEVRHEKAVDTMQLFRDKYIPELRVLLDNLEDALNKTF